MYVFLRALIEFPEGYPLIAAVFATLAQEKDAIAFSMIRMNSWNVFFATRTTVTPDRMWENELNENQILRYEKQLTATVAFYSFKFGKANNRSFLKIALPFLRDASGQQQRRIFF
jgi:hypothetical protein